MNYKNPLRWLNNIIMELLSLVLIRNEIIIINFQIKKLIYLRTKANRLKIILIIIQIGGLKYFYWQKSIIFSSMEIKKVIVIVTG